MDSFAKRQVLTLKNKNLINCSSISLEYVELIIYFYFLLTQIKTFKDDHTQRVGSLAWNKHILTSGGMDGKIINRDVRAKSPTAKTYMGYQQKVYGLKWSDSGR